MPDFKQIPDESSALPTGSSSFTKRKIRKAGDDRLLDTTERLLARFIEEGENMLVSELNDLAHALYRTTLHVQRVKQSKLIKRLQKTTRTNVKIEE